MNIVVSKIPIISNTNQLYTGCTSDGNALYFTNENSNEIHIFDINYCYNSSLNINLLCRNIAYNKTNSTFYLSINNNNISCFDHAFKNGTKIDMNFLRMYKDKIVSISYFDISNTLYIVTVNDILSINLNDMKLDILSDNIKTKYSDICFSAIYNNNGDIFIGYNVSDKTYLATLDENNNLIHEYHISDNCKINNIFVTNNVLKLFVTNEFNYIFETNLLDDNLKLNISNTRGFKTSFNNMCKCSNNNEINNCVKCMQHECECCNCQSECECCPHKPHYNKENIYDLIESIALEEAGISHVLNAEGEKIQKVIASNCDICTILKVNESVSKTISNITILEQILLSKLETISNIICHDDSICNECNCCLKCLNEND
ncbi:MAG: hypothetical protein RSB76_02765 [Clostridia bacterium]